MASTLFPKNTLHDEIPGQPGACSTDRARGSLEDAVVHSAEDAAEYVGRKAEAATAAVGDGLKSLGNTIRAHTHDGIAGEASAAVANTLESTGRYLQEEGLKGMTEDVTALIRRNPIPAMLVAFGAGFLIARATFSRS